MIGTCRFTATFKDLAAAVELSYHAMKRGKLVTDLLVLRINEISSFCYQETSTYGSQGCLRMLPKVILKVLRHIMIPSLGGDGDTMGWPFFEIVTVVLSRDLINLLDWMIR